jgi:hypothetical protein
MKQLSNQAVSVVALAANDLPAGQSVERARLRERDRKLRGPTWSSPDRTPLRA